MHSCVYVIIDKHGDVESLVAEAMFPFDEHLTTKPYKLHLSASTITAMAVRYGLKETDHKALVTKLPEWLGSPGGIDRLGLYALISSNPDGNFDWYEIGGRFNGWIHGTQQPRPHADAHDVDANTLSVPELLGAKDFAKRLPFAVVTPTGEWIERSTVTHRMDGFFLREEPRAAWTRRVRQILRAFQDYRVVCVDTHC